MSTNRKEYKGKTVDEAIAKAVSDLKASREELEIEVVAAGSAGIFGLCKKKAVILVCRKGERPVEATPCPPAEGAPSSLKPGRHHGKPPKEHARPRSAPRRDPDSAREGDDSPAAAPTPEVMAEIQELTQTFLRLMGFPLAVTVSVKGNKVTAHISAENDADAIIGRDGGTLDAIQYLLRKIVTQKFPGKIILDLDAGNYREDRRKELEELALEMAKRVKESGKSEVMGALNPAERRIVHVTLQDDTAIRSASIGEGLFKKVRIYLPGKGRKRSSDRTRGGSVAHEPDESQPSS
jgi:spoIIIJ-associated protein